MCWLIRTSEIFDEVIKQEFKNENPHEPPGVGGRIGRKVGSIEEVQQKITLKKISEKCVKIAVLCERKSIVGNVVSKNVQMKIKMAADFQ